MIGRLQGVLSYKGVDGVLIDVGGVGYELQVPAVVLARMPALGERCTVVVHTHMREDGITLYGFATTPEREAFRLLQTVTGVGPRVALALLSGLPVDELTEAIVRGDLARLKSIPGVGKKTAERICLELRDKIGATAVGGLPGAPTPAATGSPAGQVVSALVNLGYRPGEASLAARTARDKLGEEAGLEALLRESLLQLVG